MVHPIPLIQNVELFFGSCSPFLSLLLQIQFILSHICLWNSSAILFLTVKWPSFLLWTILIILIDLSTSALPPLWFRLHSTAMITFIKCKYVFFDIEQFNGFLWILKHTQNPADNALQGLLLAYLSWFLSQFYLLGFPCLLWLIWCIKVTGLSKGYLDS